MKPFAFRDSAIRNLGVIDGESYWTEPADLWTSRAPAKFKDRVPQTRKTTHGGALGGGETYWVIDGRLEIARGTHAAFDKTGEKLAVAQGVNNLEDVAESATNGAARVKLLDEQGIKAQIVYPEVAGLSGVHYVTQLADRELELECIKIYNDAAAELQKESGNRLFPQGILPARTEDAMKEIRRAREDLKLTGFTLSDDLANVDLPDYGDPVWEPFWEYANSASIPFNFRSGGNMVDTTRTVWPSYTAEEAGALFQATLSMTLGPTIGNFLYSGMYDRYPNLKMVTVGSGVGWLPFYLEIADYQFYEMVAPEDQRIKRRPTEYFRSHWYVTFSSETSSVKSVRSFIPNDHMLFSTRFPHPTGLSDQSEPKVLEVLNALDEPARRGVLRDNALAVYQLPV